MPHIILRTIHTLWALTLSQMVCVFLFCVFIETVPALQLSLKKEGETNEIFWVSHSNCVRVFWVTLFTSLSLCLICVSPFFERIMTLLSLRALYALCVYDSKPWERERIFQCTLIEFDSSQKSLSHTFSCDSLYETRLLIVVFDLKFQQKLKNWS